MLTKSLYKKTVACSIAALFIATAGQAMAGQFDVWVYNNTQNTSHPQSLVYEATYPSSIAFTDHCTGASTATNILPGTACDMSYWYWPADSYESGTITFPAALVAPGAHNENQCTFNISYLFGVERQTDNVGSIVSSGSVSCQYQGSPPNSGVSTGIAAG